MADSNDARSVAVFGAGTFGRNHLRIYRQLEQSGDGVRVAAIVDTDPATAEKLRREENLPVFSSPEACLEACRAGQLHLDAVSICVPTSAHYAVASQALGSGSRCPVGKAHRCHPNRGRCLGGAGRSQRPDSAGGFARRFNPAVTAAQSLVNGPHVFEAHRLSVFHRRALDVDVVLDLMIHDLDIVLTLVRSPVQQLHAVGLRILSSQVDIANVPLELASGCVANFTASRVSTDVQTALLPAPPLPSSTMPARTAPIINVAPGENGSAALAANKPTFRAGSRCSWRSKHSWTRSKTAPPRG